MSESELTWLNCVHISENERKKERGPNLSRNASTEEPPSATWAYTPVLDVIWVGPHEICCDIWSLRRRFGLGATHHKMRLRAEFPALGKEHEFGQGYGCLAKALRVRRVLRHRLSGRVIETSI